MKILVLGASGFVGRAVVDEAVARHGAAAVIAGVRRPDPGLAALGIEVRLLDAADGASLRTAAHGATHVIDCVMGTPAVMTAVTSAIVALAAEQPICRIVSFSSIAVHGDAEGDIDAGGAVGSGIDDYGAAKLAGETMLRAASVPATILRPALIYGPGSAQWTLRIARLLKAGRLGDLGAAGEGLCNLVHVRDVAAIAVAALNAPDAEGTALLLAAPAPVSWNRYFEDFASALGVPCRVIAPRRLALERWLAYPLKALEIVGRKAGRRTPEPITPGFARLFGQRARYDGTAAASLLSDGWTDYQAGLAESAAWAKGQGL